MAIQQETIRELALFAGAGGGILGGHILGWRTICAVERDAYAASILIARQNDESLPVFPIWSDVTTFDGRPWRGRVDVISGGFPCQDISAAGKGAGIDGERSGLWGQMARIISEVRPQFAFLENSPMLTSRGLGRVLGDLASMGYDARWCVLGADDVGAPHQRKRIWILANATCDRHQQRREKRNFPEANGGQDGQVRSIISGAGQQSENMAYESNIRNPDNYGCSPAEVTRSIIERGDNNTIRESQAFELARPSKQHAELAYPLRKRCDQMEQYDNRRTASEGAVCSPLQRSFDRGQSSWWEVEPELGRVADGVAYRVDRLRAIGNGQVSAVAATAWTILSRGLQ